jgi:hypothetical protein
MKPTTHGGKRPGAGRKPGRKTVQIRVYEETAETVRKYSKAHCQTIADTLDQRLW